MGVHMRSEPVALTPEISRALAEIASGLELSPELREQLINRVPDAAETEADLPDDLRWLLSQIRRSEGLSAGAAQMECDGELDDEFCRSTGKPGPCKGQKQRRRRGQSAGSSGSPGSSVKKLVLPKSTIKVKKRSVVNSSPDGLDFLFDSW